MQGKGADTSNEGPRGLLNRLKYLFGLLYRHDNVSLTVISIFSTNINTLYFKGRNTHKNT